RLRAGSVARIRPAPAGRFGLYRQRGFVWSRAFWSRRHDQSADELRPRALRGVVESVGYQRLPEGGGSAKKGRYCSASGRSRVAKIRTRASARSFSHAGLRRQTLSQVGNRADAQGGCGKARTRTEDGGDSINVRARGRSPLLIKYEKDCRYRWQRAIGTV